MATLAEIRAKLQAQENKGPKGGSQGGDNAICRDDTNGISTNGAVVIAPERREIHACHGLPSRASWRVLQCG